MDISQNTLTEFDDLVANEIEQYLQEKYCVATPSTGLIISDLYDDIDTILPDQYIDDAEDELVVYKMVPVGKLKMALVVD